MSYNGSAIVYPAYSLCFLALSKGNITSPSEKKKLTEFLTDKLCKSDTYLKLVYITQDNLQTFMRSMLLKLKVKSEESKQSAHMHVCTHTEFKNSKAN